MTDVKLHTNIHPPSDRQHLFLRTLTLALSIIFLMSAAFLGGYWSRDQQLRRAGFHLLAEAYNLLVTRGLKEAPPVPTLEYGMIRGMLQAYDDPYSSFVEPAVHELQTNQLEGSFGGIGVEVRKDDQGQWLLFPFPESPAQMAGVQEGDRLLAVDDLRVNSQTTAEVIQAAVRGPTGSQVTLTLARPLANEAIQLKIKRQEIALPTVTWWLDPGQPRAGVLRVNLMGSATSDEIQRAVQDLQKRSATHFILDLRDNPGGYLTAGIQVARLFLKEGTIMQQQYRGKDIESYRVEKPGPLVDIPLAVLVNYGSASAAEIVAGALQAAGRAPLIGIPTYGKDTIQLVFELQDKSSLHLTAARWWLPGLNYTFGGVGLQPDIRVDPQTSPEGIDLVIQAALQYFFAPTP